MDSYLPIIFHLKEIASLYKRNGEFPVMPVDCHSSLAATSTIFCEEREKSGSSKVSTSATPFQPVSCCGSYYIRSDDYKEHLNTAYHYLRIGRTCSVCAEYFNSVKALASHMIKEHDLCFKFKCQVCSSSYRKAKTLSAHMRAKHLSLFTVQCDKCEFTTWSGSDLAKHVEKVHPKLPSRSRSGFKPTECCGRVFKYPSHWKRHQKHCRSSRSRCKICDEYFDGEEARNEHMKVVHKFINGKWGCLICNEGFSSNGCLTTHVKAVHVKSTVFECSKCSFTSARKDALSRHVKRSHQKKSKCFKCDICGRMFLRKDHLTVHKNNIHFSDKPYCEICSLIFKSVQDLEKHKLLHRPCQICGKIFKLSKQRESHYKQHLSGKLDRRGRQSP